MTPKPGRNAYFMTIAFAASTMATCPRRKVGAVLVAKKRVISTGYNGSPSGLTDCFRSESHTGECMFEGHCVNTIHAEVNALLRAREQGDELFCTDTPCLPCLKAVFSHNPEMMIWYLRDYEDPARDHFVKAHRLENRLQRISDDDVYDMQTIKGLIGNVI